MRNWIWLVITLRRRHVETLSTRSSASDDPPAGPTGHGGGVRTSGRHSEVERNDAVRNWQW